MKQPFNFLEVISSLKESELISRIEIKTVDEIHESGIYKVRCGLIRKICQKKYKHNPDSHQMCCMWSTINPPDTIEDTKPICEIENTFDINLDEDEALILYDMHLDEADQRIIEITHPGRCPGLSYISPLGYGTARRGCDKTAQGNALGK